MPALLTRTSSRAPSRWSWAASAAMVAIVDDVKLPELYGEPVFGESSRGGVAVLGSAREQDAKATSGELPARLQTQTAVRPGYEGRSAR
jgi:hypothetical protein